MCAFWNATHPSIQPPAATVRFDRAPYTCPSVYHMVIHFILDEVFKHIVDHKGKTNWTVTSWRGLGALFKNRSNLCGLPSCQKPTLCQRFVQQYGLFNNIVLSKSVHKSNKMILCLTSLFYSVTNHRWKKVPHTLEMYWFAHDGWQISTNSKNIVQVLYNT